MASPALLSLPLVLSSLAGWCAASQDQEAEAWTRFRGPNGSGVGQAQNLPETLDAERTALWRREFFPGHSSPVALGKSFYVTGFDADNLYTACIAVADGATQWQQAIPRTNKLRIDGRNNAASPTPALDEDVVVVFFPELGLVGYDHGGTELWRTPLGPFDNIYGMGASPLLVGERVLLACDQTNGSYLAAFDKLSGKELWRSMRPWAKSGHCTPILIPAADGGQELILPGSFYLDAYDLETGERKWWVGGLSFEMKSVPVYAGGLLYTNGYGSPLNQVGNQITLPNFGEVLEERDADGNGLINQGEMPPSKAANWFTMVDLAQDGELDAADWGFLQDALASKNGLLAIRPPGPGVRGELPASSIAWSYHRAVPQLPSPIVYGDVLYMLQDAGGLLLSMDPSSGALLERGRLEQAVDTYYASPIAADGKLYLCSENGKLIVLPQGGSLEPLSVSDLGERVYATPIVHQDSILLRSEAALYRFGATKVKGAALVASVSTKARPEPKAAVVGNKDWPTWGGSETRSSYSNSVNLPDDFNAGEFVGVTDVIDIESTENVKWIAKLGSSCYGNPTVAAGRVYVGTNNETPRDERIQGDYSLVYCLEEQTGELIWQLSVPKLGTGPVSDWEYLGMCSSPTVDGERVYLVTTRCELICLDVNGMADGNDGFQGEAQYMAGPGKTPIPVADSDADIIWVLDMIKECGVAPHNTTTSAVLAVDDLLWVSTSNGVNYEHSGTPAPEAPSLILVDKLTGSIVAEENSGLSSRMFHSNWSTPAYLRTPDTELCIFGGPDGFCYAFSKELEDTPGAASKGKGSATLKEVWRFDCNPPEYRTKDGQPIKYTHPKGPSEILGTPITGGGLIYCLTGQDPDHGEGVGNLVCLTPEGKLVWSYSKIYRSMSMMALGEGLLFAADYSGFIYCFDAKTGELHWRHDTKGHIWGSPLLADGKLYIGNEDGYLTILKAKTSYDESEVLEVDMTASLYGAPIAANDVLYITTPMNLYAIAKPKQD